MKNHFEFRDGHVLINGAEVNRVTDVEIHIEPNRPAQVQLKFETTNLDADLTELQQ